MGPSGVEGSKDVLTLVITGLGRKAQQHRTPRKPLSQSAAWCCFELAANLGKIRSLIMGAPSGSPARYGEPSTGKSG
jgi:hypothetical protein